MKLPFCGLNSSPSVGYKTVCGLVARMCSLSLIKTTRTTITKTYYKEVYDKLEILHVDVKYRIMNRRQL